MSNTLDETAKQFTDELFAGDDLTDFDTQTEKNDAYVMCMAFGNHLMEQPLASRMTEEEKERVRDAYNEAVEICKNADSMGSRFAFWNARKELLETIFGKEFFKE